MLNLKLSVFVASLTTAAVVGGIGSTFFIQVFAPEPEAKVCEMPAPATSGRNTFRHVDPIQTGQHKGY